MRSGTGVQDKNTIGPSVQVTKSHKSIYFVIVESHKQSYAGHLGSVQGRTFLGRVFELGPRIFFLI